MEREKELVIDLKDLIVYVAKKWYYLLFFALVFALFIGGYKSVASINSQENQYSEENEIKLTDSLTATELKNVNNLFNRYMAYKNRISFSESYIGNSILMKLNPNSLPTLNVQYSVSSDHNNIMSYFTNQTLGAVEYEAIAKLFGEVTDATRISELIAIYGTTTDSDGMVLDVNNRSEYYTGSINNTYKWIMSLNVYANSETQCNNIMDIVEKAVQLKYQTLLDAGINVSIIKLGSNFTENSSNWLADRQRTMISETSSLESEYDKFEKAELSNLSSGEKKYFEFLKNRYENKQFSANTLKFWVLGGIAGFSLSFIIILLIFFFNGKIRNMSDYLYRVNNDNILSVIYSGIKHKGLLNRLINTVVNKLCYDFDSKYDTEEKARITAKRIKKICQENKVDSLYIVNDSTKQSAKSLISSIIDGVSNEGLSVYCGKPLSSSADYDMFEKSKAVIYYGNFYDSKSEMVTNYSKLFKENNCKVLGSILHGEI